MSELRFDPLKSRWTTIAPERAIRPFDFKENKYYSNNESFCPFCPGNEAASPNEILRFNEANSDNWALRVVPNKFPAFKVEGDVKRKGYGPYNIVEGIGAHEVVIETPKHNLLLKDYSLDILYNMFRAFKLRILDLRKDIRFRYIFAFKNFGFTAGATLTHPHSQIIAMPIIPNAIKYMLKSAKQYYASKERCLICDILNLEYDHNERVIIENSDFVAICPFSSFTPFETRIYPIKHSHDFTATEDDELLALANLVKEILSRLDNALKNPHLNIILHTSPPLIKQPAHPEYWHSIFYDYHWHLEIVPRLTGIAAFELATGININVVKPEEAAKFLKYVSVK
ncbi:MAG: galactose-1-phosphate uridylyltransferase [Deferribacterota bacterium]|nr:galactose-1-phosphate uridylyltransferase [Deferribacterota bacterium]